MRYWRKLRVTLMENLQRGCVHIAIDVRMPVLPHVMHPTHQTRLKMHIVFETLEQNAFAALASPFDLHSALL